MFNPNASLDFGPTTSYDDRLMTKAKMLEIQSKNMAIVVTHFSTTSEIRDAFMANKVEINNQRLNKMKINNLKITRDLAPIIENKFRIRIILV
jgi:hypothetical protein